MNRREHYLELLGIDSWRLRGPATRPTALAAAATAAMATPERAPAPMSGSVSAPASASPSPVAGRVIDEAVWERLRAEVSACRRCGLCESRTQTVFGVGNRAAELLVIGEAPGAEEDRRGEPFVGRAGQLLNSMLQAIGCARTSVYIANVLKCRPPNNRDPSPAEVAACLAYLSRQIELLRPRLILVVGRIAAQNLLATDVPIGRLRGSLHHFGPHGIPLVVTYHPAYLLRSPGEKRRAWQDLKLARSELHRARPAHPAAGASVGAAGMPPGAAGGLGDRAGGDGVCSA